MDKPKEIVKAVVAKIKGTNAEIAKQRLDICTSNKCGCYSSQIGVCRICKCFTSVRVHNESLHCPLPSPLW